LMRIGMKGERTVFLLSSFLQVKNKHLTVDNLDLLSDVSGGERVVSGDHDATVAGVGEGLEGSDGVGLERAVEDEETGEFEVGFDAFAGDGSEL
jgi:hypothetical protein